MRQPGELRDTHLTISLTVGRIPYSSLGLWFVGEMFGQNNLAWQKL